MSRAGIGGHAQNPRRPGPQPCAGTGKTHRDAERLVEFLIGEGGAVKLNNEEIARKLNFSKSRSERIFILDAGRFQRARAHVNDARDQDGKPCCHYNVNYRRSGSGGSLLALIDPDGKMDEHWRAALADVHGLMSREQQRQTESRRCVQQVEDLSDWCFSRGDKRGYRACQAIAADLNHYGVIHPETLGEFIAWAEDLAAKG